MGQYVEHAEEDPNDSPRGRHDFVSATTNKRHDHHQPAGRKSCVPCPESRIVVMLVVVELLLDGGIHCAVEVGV